MAIKTTKQFANELYKLKGDKYTVIGEYANWTTPILIKCNKCDYNWNVFPSNVLSKNRECPKCNNREMKVTTEIFKKRVFDEVGLEYEVLGEYKGSKTKILMRHNNCGNEYLVRPEKFKAGRRCPYCKGIREREAQAKTNEEFLKEVKKQVGDEYTVLSKYINYATKVKIIHNKCKKEFLVTPNSFLGLGTRCPECYSNSISGGEKQIRKYLKDNNIDFKDQYSFKDCKYKHKLRFDFAIFENEKLKFLIEYNGKQHYEPIKLFGGEDNFDKVKTRDNIKKEFCKNNNIELIEISYKFKGKKLLEKLDKIFKERG